MPHFSTSSGSVDPEPAGVGPHRLLDPAGVLAQGVGLRELEEEGLGFGAGGAHLRRPGHHTPRAASGAVGRLEEGHGARPEPEADSGFVIASKKARAITR